MFLEFWLIASNHAAEGHDLRIVKAGKVERLLTSTPEHISGKYPG